MKQFLLLLLALPLCGCTVGQDLLIVNANIIDVEDGSISENSSILISNGQIAQIAQIAQDKIKAPNSNYQVINAKGRYVLPGLIDGHVHTTALPENQAIDALQKTLKGGVTTVRDMGGDGIQIQAWQNQQEALNLPSILNTCILAGSSWMDHDFRAKASAHGAAVGTSPWLKSVDKVEDVDDAVEIAKSFPVNGLKIYADVAEELLLSIMAKAKEEDLPVYAHATIYPTGPKEVIAAGVDVISHVERLLTVLDSDIAPTYAADRRKHKTYTLDQLQDPSVEEILKAMREKGTALDATLFISKLRANQLNTAESTLPAVYELTKRAHQVGVPIIAGTDQMMSPLQEYPNLHEELRLLVEECDLSNLAAIQAATIIPVKYFRLGQLGKIKEGYVADLILLEENPLEDINHSKKIFKVIKNGKVIK